MEAELVGVSDYLAYNIDLVSFMKEQGYELNIIKLFQDNQSATRMEVNNRKSCKGNFLHVNICYLFVRYRVDKKKL